MDKITLDTNSWRDWAWSEGIRSETRHGGDSTKKQGLKADFAKLRSLRQKNLCDIGNPMQIYLDFEKTDWKLRSDLQAFIASHSDTQIPVVFSFPLAFPMVFGLPDEYDSLFNLIFPDAKPEHKKYKSSRVDAMLLYAHIKADRDIFITSDKAFLRAKDKIKSNWQATVMSLETYLRNSL